MSQDDKLNRLRELYKTPGSNLFLTKNAQDIYQGVKKDTLLYPTTFSDIYKLKNTIESDFRQREHRILRGKTRYLSRRRFITFSPCSILLGNYYI